MEPFWEWDFNYVFFVFFKALEKKKLIVAGLLDKFGKTNDQTPKGWKDYKNYRYFGCLFRIVYMFVYIYDHNLNIF